MLLRVGRDDPRLARHHEGGFLGQQVGHFIGAAGRAFDQEFDLVRPRPRLLGHSGRHAQRDGHPQRLGRGDADLVPQIAGAQLVQIDLPDEAEQLALWRYALPTSVPLAPDVDLSRIVATLERFGYRVIGRYQEAPHDDDSKERLDMLMKYLNI